MRITKYTGDGKMWKIRRTPMELYDKNPEWSMEAYVNTENQGVYFHQNKGYQLLSKFEVKGSGGKCRPCKQRYEENE